MATGAQSKPHDEAKRAEWRQHMDSLREVPISELHRTFSPTAVEELDRYQLRMTGETRDQHVGRIITEPFSPAFVSLFGTSLYILKGNTAVYDDTPELPDLEDKMYDDQLLTDLTVERKQHPNQEEIGEALRVRRSVVAYILTVT